MDSKKYLFSALFAFVVMLPLIVENCEREASYRECINSHSPKECKR